LKEICCLKKAELKMVMSSDRTGELVLSLLKKEHSGCLAFEGIAHKLFRVNKSLNVPKYLLNQSLEEMVEQGLLTVRTVDQTQDLIRKLRIRSVTSGSVCLKCDQRKFVPLYMQIGMLGMRKVSSFCLECSYVSPLMLEPEKGTTSS
jgi:hypothetical protein